MTMIYSPLEKILPVNAAYTIKSERIVELQEPLTLDYYKKNHENIQAAIKYHRGFPGGEFCSDSRVYFMDWRKLEEEDPLPPMWAEV
jgi:hypothetical protein